MAHKQPDFRTNNPAGPRAPGSEGARTDEVIGRFQSTSTGGTSAGAAGQEDAARTPATGEPRGGGLGRFFRAASERLTRGGGRTARREEGASGRRPETWARDEARSFEASGYGEARSGGMGRERGFTEPGYGDGGSGARGAGRERSFDDMNEREPRERHPSAYDEARDIQRRGYPEAAYGGGLREDRGLYSDFDGSEGARGTGRSSRSGRELPRSGWQREPLTAQEIMTRNPRSVRRETPLRDAAQIMKDENVGIVPVVDEGGRLVGVLTDRDIVVRAFVDERSPVSLRVAEVMTDDVEAVTPEEGIHEIIELMGRKQVRRVPVVDREDRLLGIIAMADIANRAEQDEELQAALERISSRRSFWSRL